MSTAEGTLLLKDDGDLSLDDDGNLLLSDGTSDCDCCPAPCSCPGGLASAYAIVGYSDGYFDLCPTCILPESPAPTWDGVFVQGGPCNWEIGPYSIRNSNIVGSLVLDEANCKWVLELYCETNSGTTLLWSGENSTSRVPACAFTRTGGCDSLATVTLA